MQTYNGDQLIDTKTAEISALAAHLENMIEEQAATHGVIGLMPNCHEIITINGLRYEVISKSIKQGTLYLKLQSPKVKRSKVD